MLTPQGSIRGVRAQRGVRIAIIASRYNGRYVNSMLKAAREWFEAAGATEVRVIRVPGAFEIPVVASVLSQESIDSRPEAILCLGVILRGATTHAAHIGEAVTHSLSRIQESSGVPVIHEVLLLENSQQAQERCIDARTNRGLEAASTAWEMVSVLRRLKKPHQPRSL